MKNLTFLACIICLFSACISEKDSNIPDQSYSEYIRAYTTGYISRAEPIRIVVDKESILPGHAEAQKEWLKIEPKLEGELTWVEENVLQFSPNELPPSGTEFKAKLNLSAFTKASGELTNFGFGWRTYDQSASLWVEELAAYDSNPEWQFMVGNVSTADAISNEEAEQLVTAKQQGRNLSLSWVHNGPMQHSFTVDSVRRQEDAGELFLSTNGDLLGIESEEISQRIPGLNEFEVLSHRVVQEPDQYVTVVFSDPLDTQKDLDGLILLDGYARHKVVVDGNELTIYPSSRQSGSGEIELLSAIRNTAGYELKEDVVLSVQFEMIKPQIRFVDGQKTFLPSSNKNSIPFEAVNLDAVDVSVVRIYEDNILQFLQTNEYDGNYQMKRVGRVVRKKTISLTGKGTDLSVWNRYYLDLSELIDIDPSAIYRVELNFRMHQSTYRCDEDSKPEFTEKELKEWDSHGEDESGQWDFQDNYYYSYWDDDYYYDYDYRERNNPCHRSFYRRNRKVSRNVISTDIGIISKSGTAGGWDAWVMNLVSGKPEPGAKVEWLDFQGQALSVTTSDQDGKVSFTATDKTPFLIQATSGDQKGFLKINRNRALSLSNFDVAGGATQDGLKGYIYGERGVWRPGDTLFLSFMLDDPEKTIPLDHPISIEVNDSRYKPVFHQNGLLPTSGHLAWSIPTSEASPTGTWNARVRVGNAVFSKSLRIETVKPNRLKINLEFEKEEIQASDNAIVGDIQVNWLHGAPARNLRTEIAMDLMATGTQFEGYKGFIFDDPARKLNRPSSVIFDEKVDDDGKAKLSIRLDELDEAPGKLTAVFNTRAFETGGDFSIDMQKVKVSPYNTYVGTLKPQPDRYHMLFTDSTHRVEVRTVSPEGKPKARKNLRYTVHKLSWRWWWRYNREDLSNYAGRNSANLVKEGEISTNAQGEGYFDLSIQYPQWGRYLVRVEDLESGHASGFICYYDWPAWRSRDTRQTPEGETMLVLNSDKEEYQLGDEAEITFPGAANGMALVTIEDGRSVLQSEWIETSANTNTYRFPIEKGYAPNVYVAVSLIQPHADRSNDTPIRMYGVTRVKVKDPNTTLQPVITMADAIRPETDYDISVSEESGSAMSYTLAVVDEGLLALTRFKTPNPHSYFYAQEALGVRTLDIYDYVMNAYAGEISPLLSIGGDEDSEPDGPKKANRFKPVVRFLGPFKLEKGKTKQHQLHMENYVGAVRVMVVAKNGEAYGRAEKEVKVKKPLMVLGTLPRVLGPGEEVELPVTVFAMEDHIENVKIEIKANSLLQPLQKANKQITFDRIGDKVENFRFKVADLEGIATVDIQVSGHGETAHHSIELDVRNPNPPVTTHYQEVIEKGENWELDFALPGMEGTNELTLEVSSFKPVDISSRLNYLISYPHGCAEQTTSRAFPQLYLEEAVSLTPSQKERIRDHINAAIHKLIGYQSNGGGFVYWRGNTNINDWSTSYVGHFLLEAKKKGYPVPEEVIKRWVQYQMATSTQWRKDHQHRYRDELAQSYRLFTLALAGKPNLGAMNRLKERKDLTTASSWKLAAAYHLAGKPEVADLLLQELDIEVETYDAYSPYFGSYTRDMALVAEALIEMKDRKKAAALVNRIIDQLNARRWMSTQETAMCLVAVGKFLKEEQNKKATFSFKFNQEGTVEASPQKSIVLYDLDVSRIQGNRLTFENSGDRTLFVRLSATGQPVENDQPAASNGLDLTVEYLNTEGEEIDINRLEQGTDIIARVSINKLTSRKYLPHIALTHIFPSGWEILNDRMLTVGTDQYVNSYFNHQDIRDDRVLTYFNMYRSNDKVVYHVRLNAAYQGRFYLPSVSVEMMYDGETNGRTHGQWIEVVPPGVL